MSCPGTLLFPRIVTSSVMVRIADETRPDRAWLGRTLQSALQTGERQPEVSRADRDRTRPSAIRRQDRSSSGTPKLVSSLPLPAGHEVVIGPERMIQHSRSDAEGRQHRRGRTGAVSSQDAHGGDGLHNDRSARPPGNGPDPACFKACFRCATLSSALNGNSTTRHAFDSREREFIAAIAFLTVKRACGPRAVTTRRPRSRAGTAADAARRAPTRCAAVDHCLLGEPLPFELLPVLLWSDVCLL